MADSTIYICSDVRLTNDYQHTIYFESQSAQHTYFSGKVVKTFSDYTYLRKNWDIKVEADFEDACKWQYMYFKNGDDGKTWYYFINDAQYISDTTVKLSVEMDVMQSYLFDVTLLPSFVEREHSATDEPGDNIIPEHLDVGPLMIRTEYSTDDLNTLCILVMATYNPMYTTDKDNVAKVLSANYDGIFSGLGIYAVQMSSLSSWGAKLALLDDAGLSDGIISMWMYPKNLIELADGESWADSNVCHKVARINKDVYHPTGRIETVGKSYIPTNKKLLCYPYNFLYVTNNSGGGAVYKYELFSDPTYCNFKIIGTLSPEATCKLYPLNYNNVQHNYDEGLMLSGFPTCAWNQDTYKLWLAQNQNTQNLNMVTSGLTIAGGVAGLIGSAVTGNVVGAGASLGAIAGGVNSISSQMSQKEDREVQPPQAKGGYSSSVNVVAGFQKFTIQHKCVCDDYARMIDKYFHVYGYQTNKVKIPNRHARTHWTYTKTRGCIIAGNIPVADKNKIQAIYDNGVTFWVGQIGNYNMINECTGEGGA